jgi:hypothetical protein
MSFSSRSDSGCFVAVWNGERESKAIRTAPKKPLKSRILCRTFQMIPDLQSADVQLVARVRDACLAHVTERSAGEPALRFADLLGREHPQLLAAQQDVQPRRRLELLNCVGRGYQ